MSLRASIVDGLIANAGINAVIAGRAYDMFYEFEDLLNQKANNSKFPAITVEADAWENEQNQDGHDNIKTASFSITIYQQVHLGNMRSRSSTIKTAQKTLLRAIDTLNDLVVTYINNLSGTLDTYYIRNSHITSNADGVFETEGNREIVTKEINLTIIYT